MKKITLAHYYTTPDVQAKADFVGDSLDLSLKAMGVDEIIFAGVRFMAETAKILNPDAKVYLPDAGSTCSLVTQTNMSKLLKWRRANKDSVHVAYINSSAAHKATADIIVTSSIVDDVVKELYRQGKSVIFSPDYNMGTYLNKEYGFNMKVWDAVCEVHGKFSIRVLLESIEYSADYDKIVAHPESPLNVLDVADYVGSTKGMLEYVSNLRTGTVWVATEEGLLHNMRKANPNVNIRLVPVYHGCHCASCPYMKLNTVENLDKGVEIDYLTENEMYLARIPLERMIKFSQTGEINL